MITIKLSYDFEDKDLIQKYQREYSLCLRFLYNRIYDSKGKISEIDLRNLYDSIKGKDLVSKWLFQCAIKEAKQIYSKNKENKVIFGGKSNFFKRIKQKITKEKYKLNRLSSIYSIGEEDKIGNRLFRLQNDISLIFQPTRHNHYTLRLKGIGNRLKYLSRLVDLQNRKEIGITYKLTHSYVYISFDETKIEQYNYKKIDNRILSIDMNPNYIGWSIVDWKDSTSYKIRERGCYSFKLFDDKELSLYKKASNAKERIHLNNKHRHDMIDVCKNIVNKAIYYKCSIIGIENLNIKSKDKGSGRNYNRPCNNRWIRNLFVDNLTKRCNINNIKLIKVKPEYSSFVGNILYREHKLYDPILSSIEIGRRTYEFNLQYIEKKKKQEKNIVFPSWNKFYDSIVKSMEEFNIQENVFNWIDLYKIIKEAKIMYRFSLDKSNLKLFRFKSSYVYCYT